MLSSRKDIFYHLNKPKRTAVGLKLEALCILTTTANKNQLYDWGQAWNVIWKTHTFLRDKVKQGGCNWNKFDNQQVMDTPRPTWLLFERMPHSALFFHLFCWIILHKFEVLNLHHPAITTVVISKAIYTIYFEK